jgi:putative transposase
LEIAPTTYWSAKTRQPCARKIRDAELGPKIEAIWVKNYSVYGRRKLAKAARKAGLDVGRDQVARLMHDPRHPRGVAGEEAVHHPRRPGRDRAPDLVKRTSPRPAPTSSGSRTSRTARRGPGSSTWRS